MIIEIDNYRLGARVVSLARSEKAEKELKRSDLAYIVFDGENLRIEPEHCINTLSMVAQQRLSKCNDFDVFQLDDKGILYRCYDSTSADNSLALTLHCNSNCIMCPMPDGQRKNGITPSKEEYLEIIRHIPSDVSHLTITGGEPFLMGEGIFEILQTLRDTKENTEYLLLTNGRALAYKPFMERFTETAPEHMLIGIPLHGYDSETHDAITRSPGGFEQTMVGIKNLLAQNYSVEIRMVVSKLNAAFLGKIAELIVEQVPNVFRVEIMGLEMLGNAAVNKEQVWLPYREAFLAAKEAVNILVRNAITVGLYNFPLCALDKEYRMIAAKSITDYKVRFPETCDGCKLRDACGGIFQGTMRLAGADVHPIMKDD